MRRWLFVVASVLILLSLALIVLGLERQALLWYIGLGVLAGAMVLSLATRWVGR